MNRYFYCYSTNLQIFLTARGFRYICAGLNDKTLKKFWQYARTDEFNDALTEYSGRNPNK